MKIKNQKRCCTYLLIAIFAFADANATDGEKFALLCDDDSVDTDLRVHSCSLASKAYIKEENYSKAINYIEKSCNLNSGSGDKSDDDECYGLGLFYHSGFMVKQDYSKAKTYYEKSCNLINNSYACTMLGSLYNDGSGVKQDYSKANGYFEKACNLNSGEGSSKGCYALARSYVIGEYYSKAKVYFEKACNLNNALGCFHTGVLYGAGKGGRQNLSMAKWFFGRACDLGNEEGCEHYRKLNEDGFY